jgi:AcrR family transcriptional regulator
MATAKRRQQIAAEGTQGVIVTAAARLFLARGYHPTSITQIAAEAGVAVQTIYNSIGSKRKLLERVLDLIPAGERPIEELDPGRVVEDLVVSWCVALPSTAPVSRVIREAAALDAEVAALERERRNERLAEYEIAARLLEERGALRPGLTVRRAAATILAIGHPDVYRALVLEGPWDDSLWATWARSTLKAALLA